MSKPMITRTASMGRSVSMPFQGLLLDSLGLCILRDSGVRLDESVRSHFPAEVRSGHPERRFSHLSSEVPIGQDFYHRISERRGVSGRNEQAILALLH